MRKIIVVWLCFVMVGSSAFVLLDVSENVKATLITVNDDGGADYTKIQDAINAANPGDTIYVQQGIYYENLNVNKPITLEGESKENTIINGSKIGAVIKVNRTSDILIKNFTLEWSGDAIDLDHVYSGYWVVESDNCSILNCIIDRNFFGIFIQDSSIGLISDCLISNNWPDDADGVVRFWSSNNYTLKNCNFTNNYCEGGSIVFTDSAYCLVDNITQWQDFGYWGMSIDESSHITVVNSTIYDKYRGFFDCTRSVNTVLSNNSAINCDNFIRVNTYGMYYNSEDKKYYNHSITPDNTLNGKPVFYYFGESYNSLSNIIAGEIYLANCEFFNIINASIIDKGEIEIHYSNNCTLSDTAFIGDNRGLRAYTSRDLQIINCNFTSFGRAMVISDVNYSLFINNKFLNGQKSMYIKDSHNNTFIYSLIESTSNYGMYLGSGASNNEIMNNVIRNSSIYFEWFGPGNFIHHNNFFSLDTNNPVFANYETYFNDTYGEGNYWSDYTGSDTNGDGVGDTNLPWHYDNYPLMEPCIYDMTIPIALGDTYYTDEDSVLHIPTPGILANDIDYSGNTLTAIQESSPLVGSLNLSSNGSFIFIPPADYTGDVNFTYHSNNTINDSNIATVTIIVNNTNDPPQITTIDILSTTEDIQYHVDYNATDQDVDDSQTWYLWTSADFLAINHTTGVLSGTPTNADVGIYWVNVSVFDSVGDSDYSNFTLTVINTNDPPTITTLDVKTAIEDVPFSVDYNASDPDVGDILNWSLLTNASWISIDTATGLLSGTPTDSDIGFYWLNVTVEDGKNGKDWTNFTIDVKLDTDGDGIPDDTDPDDDNDGTLDNDDDFPTDPNEDTDTDEDGTGDNADTDDDNDGFLDEWEDFLGTDPKDSSDTPLDTDSDGIPDGDANNTQSWMDTDDDGDGVADELDPAPLNPDITDVEGGGLSGYYWVAIILVIALLAGLLFARMRPKSIPPSQEEPESSESEPIQGEKPT